MGVCAWVCAGVSSTDASIKRMDNISFRHLLQTAGLACTFGTKKQVL